MVVSRNGPNAALHVVQEFKQELVQIQLLKMMAQHVMALLLKHAISKDVQVRFSYKRSIIFIL